MARKQVVKKRIIRKKRSKKIDPTKKIALSLLLITIVGIVAFFVLKKKDILISPTTFESSEYFVKGIDLSHHNPILNWDMIREQNITFAYLKATEGISHEDRNYRYNYDLARKSNIHIGTYHFYSFGLSGREQAAHFKRIAKCRSGDMLPAIDVEHSPANPFSKDDKYVTGVIKELKILEKELYNHYGVHPIIYTNRDCYKLYIKGNFERNLIWICDLQDEPSDEPENWRIWQFTHKGKLPGVDGYIDLNYYRYDFDEFKELLLP